MVREGYLFGAPLLLAASGAQLLHWHGAAGILLFLGLFVLYFFRDPERVIPAEPGAVVSPADGRVVVVQDEECDGRPGKRISVFLAVWNVHVNRSPAAGRVARIEYRPGRFFAAMKARASAENEQNIIRLETPEGEIVFKQIAGWIARRVVSWKREGDTVRRGERIGLIRFGSRMDLWLPAGVRMVAKRGDTVSAGSSILAYWPLEPVHVLVPEATGPEELQSRQRTEPGAK